jgi:hypothetical protein
MLFKEPTIRLMCPIMHFMAMALADGVFVDASTFEDIRSNMVPPGTGTFTYKYQSAANSKPIMRATCPDGTILENRILSYDAFNNALKGLGQQAGYKENMSAYCFCRAFARSILSGCNSYRWRVKLTSE